jgi:translation initiation factor 1
LSSTKSDANYKFVATLKLESSGRAGKTVTVINNLPKQEIFLRELTSELKKKCGSGGTYLMDKKEGVIEIQGDKREIIAKLFTQKAFQFKI